MKFQHLKLKVSEAIGEHDALEERLNIMVRELQGKCLHANVVIGSRPSGRFGSFDEIRLCTDCGLTTTWSHGDSLRIFKRHDYPKVEWDDLLDMRSALIGPTRAGVDAGDKP